jgi:hypothetical protein
MSDPAGAAAPPIAAEVIPQVAGARGPDRGRARRARPGVVAAVATTRVRALEVTYGSTCIPASHDAPSYAVVMTGHFASYRGGPPGAGSCCPAPGHAWSSPRREHPHADRRELA